VEGQQCIDFVACEKPGQLDPPVLQQGTAKSLNSWIIGQEEIALKLSQKNLLARLTARFCGSGGSADVRDSD